MVGYREKRRQQSVGEVLKPLDLTNAGKDLPRNEALALGRREKSELIPEDHMLGMSAHKRHSRPWSFKGLTHTFLSFTQVSLLLTGIALTVIISAAVAGTAGVTLTAGIVSIISIKTMYWLTGGSVALAFIIEGTKPYPKEFDINPLWRRLFGLKRK